MSHLRSESSSLSIAQDASKGWLAVRFGHCNDRLQGGQGALGVVHIADLMSCHALKIREATNKVTKEFCEPVHPMPCSTKKRMQSSNLRTLLFGNLVLLYLALYTQPLCKSYVCPPRTGYPKAFPMLCDKVECLTADAAPDEQLAFAPHRHSTLPFTFPYPNAHAGVFLS